MNPRQSKCLWKSTYSLLGLLSLLLLGLSACHSSKRAYTGDVTTQASSASTDALFNALADTYRPWDDLYVPVTLSLESPKRMSISGRATLVYGNSINISLRMLGMEVGVVYIDNKSIYVVDKFHKYYFKEDIAKLLGDTDITIVDIQNLLLGRAVVPGKGAIEPTESGEFTFLSSDEQWIMSPVRQFKGAEWHYIASKTDPPLLTAVRVRLDSGEAIQCQFTEPTFTDCGIADGISTITIPYKGKEIKMSLNWALDDARWNTERQVNFNAPSGYKLLDMESLLKGLDSF